MQRIDMPLGMGAALTLNWCIHLFSSLFVVVIVDIKVIIIIYVVVVGIS